MLNNMKKLFFIFVMTLALICAFACGKDEKTQTGDPVVEPTSEETPEEVKYVVTFDVDGALETTEVKEGEKIGKPLDPVKEGYTFLGWYVSAEELETLYDFEAIVTANVTLVAKFEEVKVPTPEPTSEVKYVVTFDVDGKLTTAEVVEGEKAVKPADPVKEGYKFLGWYVGEEQELETLYDFDLDVTCNITLIAKFEIIFMINVESLYETEKRNISVLYNDNIIPCDNIVSDNENIIAVDNDNIIGIRYGIAKINVTFKYNDKLYYIEAEIECKKLEEPTNIQLVCEDNLIYHLKKFYISANIQPEYSKNKLKWYIDGEPIYYYDEGYIFGTRSLGGNDRKIVIRCESAFDSSVYAEKEVYTTSENCALDIYESDGKLISVGRVSLDDEFVLKVNELYEFKEVYQYWSDILKFKTFYLKNDYSYKIKISNGTYCSDLLNSYDYIELKGVYMYYDFYDMHIKGYLINEYYNFYSTNVSLENINIVKREYIQDSYGNYTLPIILYSNGVEIMGGCLQLRVNKDMFNNNFDVVEENVDKYIEYIISYLNENLGL